MFIAVALSLVVVFSSHVSFILCDGSINSPGIIRKHKNDQIVPVSQVTDLPCFRCGDGHCWCDLPNSDITCAPPWVPDSGISYIPTFPDGIKTLFFDHISITSFKLTAEFFTNATSLTKLVMHGNNLVDLEPGCMDGMKQLTELFLTGNSFTPATVQYLITIPHMRRLVLDENNIGNLPRTIFESGQPIHSNLTLLSLKENKMTSVNLDALHWFTSLGGLILETNELRNLELTQPLSFLSALNLGSNSFVQFPTTCWGKEKESLFPQLSSLDLRDNRINSIRPDICLPKLQELKLDNNRFYDFVSGTFSSHKFPILQTLKLQKSTQGYPDAFGGYTHPPHVRSYSMCNEALLFLDLKYCGLVFSGTAETVELTAFKNCQRLHVLYLDGNSFRDVNGDRFRELFGHLRLFKLTMRNCIVDKVSTVTSAGLKYLSYLDLRDNMISNIPDGAFDAMPKLEKLDLSGNAISVVTEWTFSVNTRNGLQKLIIGNNPFSCTCDLLWFRNWLRANPNLFDDNFFGSPVYVCDNLPNTKVQDFILHPQACLLSPETSKMITGVLSLIVLTMTGFLLLFSFRWHLRLLLYEAFRGRDDGVRQRRLQQNNFDYDVFVSYDSHDLPWVQQHLLPQLEDRLGLKLCIHERDFIIGNNIVDNIAECVERSKKIMMVFSKYFLRSHWCQFELTYCLRHVMDYDDNLIIVCVDDVVSREITTAMMAVLKTTTYIQWAELGEAVQSFWGRLKIALNEIVAQV